METEDIAKRRCFKNVVVNALLSNFQKCEIVQFMWTVQLWVVYSSKYQYLKNINAQWNTAVV